MPKRGRAPKPLFEPCAGGGVELRAPSWAEFEDWVNLRKINKGFLQPWEPFFEETRLTRLAYRARLSSFKSLVAADKAYAFNVFRKDRDVLVGACNLAQIQRGSSSSAHIGYWVGEAHTRQGFTQAAVRSVLRFAFTDLKLHRVSAAVQVDNKASIKLLQSTGFQNEGLARGYLKINGQWRDHLIFAKLSND